MLGGGFDPLQYFNGTLYDARLFDDVRTVDEIIQHKNDTLSQYEANMIADWRFDNFSTDGVVTEAVTGNNLTLAHAAGGGFSNSRPSRTLAVDEGAANGTVVGNILGVDTTRDALIASLLAADPDLSYDETTGKFYKFVNTNGTWSSSLTAASATQLNGINGSRATIESAHENALLTSIAANNSSHLWLGISDNLSEGVWREYDGVTAGDQIWHSDGSGNAVNDAYTNWIAGEPNDAGGEHFAQLVWWSGEWNDQPAVSTNEYVVEWAADDVLDGTVVTTEQPLVYTIQALSLLMPTVARSPRPTGHYSISTLPPRMS